MRSVVRENRLLRLKQSLTEGFRDPLGSLQQICQKSQAFFLDR
jgi:hypothetical protein